MISFSLADEDIRAAARPSANEADWDHRYGGDQMWSGNPNGTLVNEIDGAGAGPSARRRRRRGRRRRLAGRAGLDGDRQRHLAARRWTASPPRPSGAACAIECHHADANALDAVRAARRSTSCRRSTRRSPARPTAAASDNLLDAVAPGGTLLVVEPRPRADARADRHARRTAGRSTPTPTCASTTSPPRSPTSPDWDIEVHEKRPRPPGAASDATTSTTSCCAPGAAPGDRAEGRLLSNRPSASATSMGGSGGGAFVDRRGGRGGQPVDDR